MAHKGKRHRNNLKKANLSKYYNVEEAILLLKSFQAPRFDETVEVAMNLGVDPKQADQQVRGAVVLPHGIGKKIRVAVFAKGEKEKEAKEAGADFVGSDDLVQKVQEGFLDFDKVIATPDMMVAVGKLGKVLGPRGLMPNPKVGTVTFDVAKAVQESKTGKVEFRVDKAGNIHAPVGKISFKPEQLRDNLMTVIDTIVKVKPAAAKGVYLKSVTVSSTMSPGVKIEASRFVA